jgi:hypothetical protein
MRGLPWQILGSLLDLKTLKPNAFETTSEVAACPLLCSNTITTWYHQGWTLYASHVVYFTQIEYSCAVLIDNSHQQGQLRSPMNRSDTSGSTTCTFDRSVGRLPWKMALFPKQEVQKKSVTEYSSDLE